MEIDGTFASPVGGFAGSNFNGVWIAANFASAIDGECSAYHAGVVGSDIPFKNVLHSEHGAAINFAQIGKASATGASESQPLFFISNDGTTEHFGYQRQTPGGDMVFQPNFFATPGSLIVANADLQRQSS